jgi:hypothetical protein
MLLSRLGIWILVGEKPVGVVSDIGEEADKLIVKRN